MGCVWTNSQVIQEAAVPTALRQNGEFVGDGQASTNTMALLIAAPLESIPHILEHPLHIQSEV